MTPPGRATGARQAYLELRAKGRGERRPTRDIDLQAQVLDDDAESVRAVICEVSSPRLDDGAVFDVYGAAAGVFRDEDA